MLPLYVQFKCPIQRLGSPRICTQIMVIMPPTALIHILNFFLSTASVLWPFNSSSWPLPFLLLCGFPLLLSNPKCKHFSGFCPGMPVLLNVRTPPRSPQPAHGFNDHLCTEDFYPVSQEQMLPELHNYIFNCLLDICT